MDIQHILDFAKWPSISVSPENVDTEKSKLLRKAGLYQIETNTPVSVLRQIETRKDKSHYNIGKKVKESEKLHDDFKILPKNDNEMYIVYSGHASLIRQRFIEHFVGSQGTACLALFEIETLIDYDWRFSYFDLSTIENYNDSKLVRTFLEQRHRANIGWPILCSQ